MRAPGALLADALVLASNIEGVEGAPATMTATVEASRKTVTSAVRRQTAR